MTKLKFEGIKRTVIESYRALERRIDRVQWDDYLNRYDTYSVVPYYVDNGVVIVREDILHAELLEVMEKYVQGLAPLGCGWLKNGGYYFDYKYVNYKENYSHLTLSKLVTNDLISYYSRSCIPPRGYDEYILCDALMYARIQVIRIYLKWNNRSGIDIVDRKNEMKM